MNEFADYWATQAKKRPEREKDAAGRDWQAGFEAGVQFASVSASAPEPISAELAAAIADILPVPDASAENAAVEGK